MVRCSSTSVEPIQNGTRVQRKSERHLLEDNAKTHCLEIKSGREKGLLKDLSAVIAATLGILPNQSSNLRQNDDA